MDNNDTDTSLIKPNKQRKVTGRNAVKLSNFLYEKIMYQKSCFCALAMVTLFVQLKSSFMRYNNQRNLNLSLISVEEMNDQS